MLPDHRSLFLSLRIDEGSRACSDTLSEFQYPWRHLYCHKRIEYNRKIVFYELSDDTNNFKMH